MNRKQIILLATGASLLGSVLAFNPVRTAKSVSAYSIGDLPTTIDLNDLTASSIKNYYADLNDLSASELQGNNLLKNLKPILKNNQVYYSYDYYESGTPNYIWQIYEISDRNWEKSPASELTSSSGYGTYNPSTNKITGYKYGSNYSNPNLRSLYFNRDNNDGARAWGNHQQDEWGINREHIWAKSHGMGATDSDVDSAGARGDLFHLWSGAGYSNKEHSNYSYGFVDLTSATDMGTEYANQSGNYLGTSLNKGSGKVFEPQDCDKGDIARSLFYMAARYNYLSGSDNDGIDSNNPNLILLDAVSDPNGNSTYISSSSKPGYMGYLRDLLAWNRLDPPDEWEIHRNNLLYNNYTHNRNPFIDYPEWAEYIWGNVVLENDNRSINTYSSTPTGYVDLNNDVLNGFSNEEEQESSITLDKSALSLQVDDTYTLKATTKGSGTLSWSSSDPTVATVDNGKVTALKVGSTTITATYADKSATCEVTVTEKVESTYSLTNGSPYINGVPYKMYFYSTNKTSNYYFTGSMSGYYGAASSNINSAVDVYFEENEDGQNIYFLNGDNKQYLYIKQSDSYYNFTYQNNVPDTPWYYQDTDTYKCLTYTINNVPYTFGTYGTYTTFNTVNLNTYPTNYLVQFISSDETSATALMEVLMKYLNCDSKGIISPTISGNFTWSDFEKAFNNLNTASQNLLINTDSDINGNKLEQGLARYDYLLGKYNTSSTTPYYDFLSRIENGKINLSTNTLEHNINPYIIPILIIAISGTSLILLLTIINKKKKYIR